MIRFQGPVVVHWCLQILDHCSFVTISLPLISRRTRVTFVFCFASLFKAWTIMDWVSLTLSVSIIFSSAHNPFSIPLFSLKVYWRTFLRDFCMDHAPFQTKSFLWCFLPFLGLCCFLAVLSALTSCRAWETFIACIFPFNNWTIMCSVPLFSPSPFLFSTANTQRGVNIFKLFLVILCRWTSIHHVSVQTSGFLWRYFARLRNFSISSTRFSIFLGIVLILVRFPFRGYVGFGFFSKIIESFTCTSTRSTVKIARGCITQ